MIEKEIRKIYEAAEEGNEEAFFQLQKISMDGSADESIIAKRLLGNYFLHHDQMEKSFELYKETAALGNVDSIRNLAMCYNFGWGTNQDYVKAVEYYTKGAELGNTDCMFRLGGFYEGLDPIEKDLDKVFYWEEKAANLGNADAMCSLGFYYDVQLAETNQRNQSKAIFWYKKAMALGNLEAMTNLAKNYMENGDSEEAYYLFKKASDSDEPNADYMMGIYNFYGSFDIEEPNEENINYYEAHKYFSKIVSNGLINNGFSEYYLGLIYENGLTGDKDEEFAINYFRTAFYAGVQEALEELVSFYQNGSKYIDDEEGQILEASLKELYEN